MWLCLLRCANRLVLLLVLWGAREAPGYPRLGFSRHGAAPRQQLFSYFIYLFIYLFVLLE